MMKSPRVRAPSIGASPVHRAIGVAVALSVFGVLFGCGMESDDGEEWSFDEEWVEPWGCAELRDWAPDDGLHHLGEDRYRHRHPLIVDDDHCGVYGITSHFENSEDESPSWTQTVELCNRCTEESELVWIDEPHGLVPDKGAEDWRGRHEDGTGLFELDTFNASPATRRAGRLGPVHFLQRSPDDVVRTFECSNRAGTPMGMMRYEFTPGEHVVYDSEVAFPGMWSRKTFFGTECQRSDCETLEGGEITRVLPPDTHSITVGLPLLRPVSPNLRWEEATYLPDGVCADAGLWINWWHQYGAPYRGAEEDLVTEAHRSNHFVAFLGVIQLPSYFAEDRRGEL